MAQSIRASEIRRFIESVVEGDLHAKRVLSLSRASLGVIHAASLAVTVIGRGLAQAHFLNEKHVVKQVDRLLSNRGIDVGAFGHKQGARI